MASMSLFVKTEAALLSAPILGIPRKFHPFFGEPKPFGGLGESGDKTECTKSRDFRPILASLGSMAKRGMGGWRRSADRARLHAISL
jgi:hypothetical protein